MGSEHGRRLVQPGSHEQIENILLGVERLAAQNELGRVLSEKFKQRWELWSNASSKTAKPLVDFHLEDDHHVVDVAAKMIEQGEESEVHSTLEEFFWTYMKSLGQYLDSKTRGPRPSMHPKDIPGALFLSRGFHDPVQRVLSGAKLAQRLREAAKSVEDKTKIVLDPMFDLRKPRNNDQDLDN